MRTAIDIVPAPVLVTLAFTAAGLTGCLPGYPDEGGPDATRADGGSHEAAAVDGSGVPSDDATMGDDGRGSSDDASLDQGEAAGSCLDGGSCTPAQCQLGVTACSASGAQTCVSAQNLVNGTPCDAGADVNAVCSAGACQACNQGDDCTDAGSCLKRTIACASGSPVCAAAGNASDGTSCGNNLYCNHGVCAPCTAGAGCVPTGKPCNQGSVSCSQGQANCTELQMPAANGTSCGTNQVCSGGQCVACIAGVVCVPAGSPCHTGLTSCSTGASVCMDTGPGQNGVACGTHMTCTSGACGCASGFSMCGGACVDLTSDAANCGRCGHSCYSGTCNPGTSTCTQWAVASSVKPAALVSDGTYVIWADSAAQAILQKSVSGSGSTKTLVSDPAFSTLSPSDLGDMSLANGVVAIATSAKVFTVGVNQSTTSAVAKQPFTFPSGGLGNIALKTDATRVVVTDAITDSSGQHFELYDCLLGGSTCTDVGAFGSIGNPAWGNASNATTDYVVDMSNGSIVVFYFGTTNYNFFEASRSMAGGGVAVDSTYAYWVENGSPPHVVRAPLLGGGTPTTVAAVPANTTGIGNVATDGKYVYVSTSAVGSPPVIAYAPVAGTGAAMTPLGGQSSPSNVVVAGGMVFWIDGTNIFGIGAP